MILYTVVFVSLQIELGPELGLPSARSVNELAPGTFYGPFGAGISQDRSGSHSIRSGPSKNSSSTLDLNPVPFSILIPSIPWALSSAVAQGRIIVADSPTPGIRAVGHVLVTDIVRPGLPLKMSYLAFSRIWNLSAFLAELF